ncbi:MAG TPA: hemerythrin domain-containing protein [Burkholderiales bacterium]|nr:hemerythrin domain-containing protein [Burkholderiales bacterium]
MTRISEFLTADHRRCDALFGEAAQAAESGDWERCRLRLEAFRAALRDHMASEEEVLFPAFEQATGTASGPTRVMRYEHQQMLELLGQLDAALRARDARGFSERAASFSALMAAHSAKEENVLYPLCDEALPGVTGESLQRRACAK